MTTTSLSLHLLYLMKILIRVIFLEFYIEIRFLLTKTEYLASFNPETLTMAEEGTPTLMDLRNVNHDGSSVEDEGEKGKQHENCPLKKGTTRGGDKKRKNYLKTQRKKKMRKQGIQVIIHYFIMN